MTAGNQPTLAQINLQAGSLVTGLRNNFQSIVNFNQWLNSFGQAGLLALGMSTADTNILISTFGNLNTLANVFMGSGSAPTTFNYMANSEALWGGQ